MGWLLRPFRRDLAFDMFDVERSAAEAKRAAKLRHLYHRGQDLAWDGVDVLASLSEKHGGIRVDDKTRNALGRVFDLILWGELAAWRISAQLADQIVDLEPKMAATSQAHDEARHFYVMYDYLTGMGYTPQPLGRVSRTLLESVLTTKPLAHKLLGMQLQVETMALTLFQAVREARIEPVLTELLLYFEKDEARHVGLGIQYLPTLAEKMTRRQGLGLLRFQLTVIAWSLASLKTLEPDLLTLGIGPRRIFELGRGKQLLAFLKLWEQMGIDGIPYTRELILRGVNSVARALFPEPHDRDGLRSFLRAMGEAFDADLRAQAQGISLDPGGPRAETTLHQNQA